MGKLIGTVHKSAEEKLTRPHYFRDARGRVKKGRQVIPIKLLVRIDPSNVRYYRDADGKKRRKPDTLPAHRRLDAEIARLKAVVKEAKATEKKAKNRKAA